MISALNLEIQAIKRKGGSGSIEVRGAERRGTADGNVLYAFPVTEEIYLRDESPIRAVVGQEEVDGIVVSLGEGVLLVALERDLGPKIPFARLISDDSFLVEHLKKKLEEVRAGGTSFNQERADQTIGDRPSRSAKAAVDQALTLGGEPLNDEQKAAIATALGSEITYLWGPPGTGKTTVLARIIEGYYRLGLSVLVVSNTNVAVDTALEKIGDRLRTDAGFQKGTVLRYGPVVKPELEQKYKGQVVVDEVIARLGRNLQADKVALETERVKVEAQAVPLRQAIRELEQLEEAKGSLAHLQASVQQAETKQQATRSTIATITEKLCSRKFDLERARGLGSIRRFFSGLNPERLVAEIGKAEAERTAQEEVLSAVTGEVNEGGQQLGEGKKRVKDLATRLASTVRCTSCQTQNRVPPFEEGTRPVCGVCGKPLSLDGLNLNLADCRQRIQDFEKKIEDLNREINEIQKQLDALRDEILKKCKIIATTVYRAYLKGQVERSFDVVVIDEASMLALPMVYYAAGLASRQVVVTGDFRQLPPIVTSEEAEATEWLKQDVFRKAGIAAAVSQGERPESLVALRTQYRMHEDICSVINHIFYSDHPLATAASIRGRGADHFPLGNSALLYVDTGSYHLWAALKLGTYSRYNVLHALLLRNIACHLETRGYLSPALSANQALGIVAPYTAQANLVQRFLDERLSGRGTQFAATVHRFQGNEKDTILIDLTDSLGASPSKFMRAVDLDEDGARLLNVAMSRARHHAVLIANFGYLRQKIGQGGVVRKILDLVEQVGEPLKVEELLPLGPEDWFDGLRPLEPPQIQFNASTAGIFTEGTFYPAFVRDLNHAAKSVVIFSPFLTSRGAGRWMDILRAKVAQGVHIRLVTRPPGNQGGVLEDGLQELIAGILRLGVGVDLRASMHEKFAIIDNAILWHGSLNILSHRDTSESMLRIPSLAACSQMARFVTSPARRKLGGEEDEEVDLGKRENPVCPKCSGLMVWKSSRYGLYFECETGCGGKIDPVRSSSKPRLKPAKAMQKAGPSLARSSMAVATVKVCPRCGNPMTRRTGRHGPFFGCTGYPHCYHTEPIP